MKTTVSREPKINTILDLLAEYEEECLAAVKLIEGLKLKSLTNDQMEDMLGELSASVTHLRIHSENMEKLLDKEL